MPFGQLYQRAATALPREPRLIPTKHGGRDPTKGRQRDASKFGVTEGRYFSVSHTFEHRSLSRMGVATASVQKCGNAYTPKQNVLYLVLLACS